MKARNILFAMFCTCSIMACDQNEAKTTTASSNEPQIISLATNIDSVAEKELRKPVVFISGIDEDSNKYYTKAKECFTNKDYTIIDNVSSLEEIINWLNNNYNEHAYGEIHIVSHSNSWRGMSLKDAKNGVRITESSLQEILQNSQFPKLDSVLAAQSKIIFHSCGLGNNNALLQSLKEALSSEFSPTLYASPLFNIFGSEYADHYLAKPYYGYYPTANSPGKVDLSKEFARNYPEVDINWLNALYKRSEDYAGSVYSYKFNIPVKWEIVYNTPEEIPHFNEVNDLMDFITENEEIAEELFALNIPIEKFRWNERTANNTLIIEGKVTVVCILDPKISDEYPYEYMPLDLENKQLYEKL